MNKRQAIAYAQIALDYMQRNDFKEELNLENLEKEMLQAFKIYPRNIVIDIAIAKKKARNSKNLIN